jgi:hypothetical protein
MIGFALIVYIIISVVIGGAVANYFNSIGQTTGAMISIVLLILVFTFFGLRWFRGTKTGNTVWPPIVNMCPDYMTAVEGETTTRPSKTGTFCIDTKGLYTSHLATMVDVRPKNSDVTFKGFLIKDTSNSSTKAYTSLKEDTSGMPRWPLLKKLQSSPQEIVGQGDGKYFRWEGVWDGRSATAERAPLP